MDLKALKERLALPFARFLAGLGVSPDTITILSILAGLVAGYFVMYGEFFLFSVFAFLSIGFDALDGSVARIQKRASARGRFLDQVVDRYNDAFILLAILLSGSVFYVWALVALVMSLIGSYTSEAGELNLKHKKKKVTAEGLSLRWLRWLFLVLGGFVGAAGLNSAVFIVALLATFGALQRFWVFWRLL